MGLSTGIKKLRVGTGPRGNYVHMGRGGLYFRQTLPSSKKPESRRTPLGVPEERSSSIELHDIESGSVSLMVDSSFTELLEEINSKFTKPIIWLWTEGSSICVIVAV